VQTVYRDDLRIIFYSRKREFFATQANQNSTPKPTRAPWPRTLALDSHTLLYWAAQSSKWARPLRIGPVHTLVSSHTGQLVHYQTRTLSLTKQLTSHTDPAQLTSSHSHQLAHLSSTLTRTLDSYTSTSTLSLTNVDQLAHFKFSHFFSTLSLTKVDLAH